MLQMCGAVTYCGERGLAFSLSGTYTPCVHWMRPQREKEEDEGGTLTPTVPLARSQADQVKQPTGHTTALKPPSAIWQRPLRSSGRTPAFESTASLQDTCSLRCKWMDFQLVACDSFGAKETIHTRVAEAGAAPLACLTTPSPLPQTNRSEGLSIGRAHLPRGPSCTARSPRFAVDHDADRPYCI